MVWVAAPAARGVQGTAASPQPPRAVFDKYCVTCHNQRVKTAGLALDALDPAQVGEHAEAWEKVVRKLRTGAMPPAGRPRPDKALADSVASSLEAGLDRAAAEHPNPGRPTLHRLNRVEYRNAIRDLLALEIDPAALLPADNAAYGFDNNADALSLSPALTERYLEAAAKISQMALGHLRGSLRRKPSSCRPIATRASASATINRGGRGAARRFATTFPSTASTCSSCS